MAGSYNHVVADNGNLGSNSHVVAMLENGGDVFEAVEEMYGMIWWLATQIANEQFGAAADPALYVDAAQTEYKTGLAESPTKRFKNDQRS